MVIFTLQYTQGHYYFLSVFSSGIQSLLMESLWTTFVALMCDNEHEPFEFCMYSKSKSTVSNLDHVINSYRWMTMQYQM